MSANATATSTGASAVAIPALDNTFGAILIGTFLGLIYFYLVTNYFKPQALQSGVWSVQLLAPLTGLTVLVAQSFYARRVYLLGSGYVFVVIPVALFMLGTLGFTAASSLEIYVQKTFADFVHFTWLMSAAFGCSLATDIVLAAALIVFLSRSRTAFKGTNSALSILIVYTVNTGLITSALSLVSLTFGVAQPGNMIYIASNMLATKSYINAVLAVVNSRRSITESARETGGFGTFGLTSQKQQQLSHRMPVRMEHFQHSVSMSRGQGLGEPIDVHWKIPPGEPEPHRIKEDLEMGGMPV
ncbi:hypothetical protein GSI_05542 [Ganoderma sinense ZZ0214-1]|uniref:DUF6534 domain-containing protein n=1 Tax=Ganoderma sinense ZZ0214-1 TaxID=1077348 RepID=A0A2G8SF24_9APHY|nr:hypothetical protein GSI_05542 [Ganoderma sinense ZZ0214-1]